MKLKTYLPNRSDKLALVSLLDRRPFRAYWPLRLTQIIGGKTWSLSLVRYTTKEPQVVEPPIAPYEPLPAEPVTNRGWPWGRRDG